MASVSFLSIAMVKYVLLVVIDILLTVGDQ